MHAVTDAQDTPASGLPFTPRLGLGTTDQLSVCAPAGAEAPSKTSPVTAAAADSLPPGVRKRPVRQPGTREPRARTVIPSAEITPSRSRVVAVSPH